MGLGAWVGKLAPSETGSRVSFGVGVGGRVGPGVGVGATVGTRVGANVSSVCAPSTWPVALRELRMAPTAMPAMIIAKRGIKNFLLNFLTCGSGLDRFCMTNRYSRNIIYQYEKKLKRLSFIFCVVAELSCDVWEFVF